MISVQDYLEKMLPVFQAVINCAGALLEKNAMNHTPTQEDMEQIQKGAQEIKNNLEKMEKDAAEQVRLYEEKVKSADESNRRTIEQLTATYAEFDHLKELEAAEEVSLAQVKRETERELDNLQRVQQELNDYRRRQEETVREIKRKRQEAIKWCWVPGYNIYLACDYAVEACNSNVESLEHRCRDCKKAIEQFEQKAKAHTVELETIVKRRDALSVQCEQLNKKSQDLQRELAQHKTQLVYWEDMRLKVSDLKSRLLAGSMVPDDLMELMDMMEMFGEGI